jgi:predicted transcriptional regulator of viral defense system
MVRATTIERTLVDLTVRPIYGGGVENVLAAYNRAKGQMSARKLAATLKALDYVYPFHQAVGFYLQRAGYPETDYGLFQDMEMKFNFYLAHNLRGKTFDPKWRLYHPKGT